MIRNILKTFIIILISMSLKAQSITGQLSCDGQSRVDLKLENNSAVSLYKAMREGKYPILFRLKGKDMYQDAQGNEVAIVWFKTSLYRDGKLLITTERQPMPFFPGDMLMPIESFDLVSLLIQTEKDANLRIRKNPGALAKGKYEVRISARVADMKGELSSLSFFIN